MLYLDTSALVKRYVREPGSTVVVAAMTANSIRATNVVAYAELRATFARALRAGRIDAAGLATLLVLLDSHWPNCLVLAADDTCLRTAGRLVDHHAGHALRSFDAIHLASAHRLASGTPAAVTFACWDLRLWRAARDDGFTMIPAAEPL